MRSLVIHAVYEGSVSRMNHQRNHAISTLLSICTCQTVFFLKYILDGLVFSFIYKLFVFFLYVICISPIFLTYERDMYKLNKYCLNEKKHFIV